MHMVGLSFLVAFLAFHCGLQMAGVVLRALSWPAQNPIICINLGYRTKQGGVLLECARRPSMTAYRV
jgi:hypothetical protein